MSKPHYIIADTEGTGLFLHSRTQPDGTKVTVRSDEPGQPRMAEYAHVLLDADFNVESTYQQYIIPRGWQNADLSPMLEMPEEAFKVHGLSMDFLRGNGKPVGEALDAYEWAIIHERVLIGFNQQHDGRQIRAELRHDGRDDLFERTPNICAMRSITSNYKGQVKKLNGKGGFPRLIDAAAHFGIPYDESKRHSALEDAMVTAQVAQRLHQKGLLLPAEVHYSRNFEGRNGEAS
jgi:DNA polymerase-3 subunit epsilon